MKTKSNSDTKTQALELAKTYLQTLGFNGFSFQTIADALGIKKASLHYYFASKEDMGLALIKDYEDGYQEWVERVSKLPSKEKLEKMVKGFIKLSEKNQMICPLGVFSSDYHTVTNKIKKKTRDFHLIQREWIMKTIEQGKKEGTIKKSVDTSITADWIMATLQGGVQVARLRGEMESLKKMLDTMLENIHAK
jgi:TetR/AcrR family transcriptional repressor of nem operon